MTWSTSLAPARSSSAWSALHSILGDSTREAHSALAAAIFKSAIAARANLRWSAVRLSGASIGHHDDFGLILKLV